MEKSNIHFNKVPEDKKEIAKKSVIERYEFGATGIDGEYEKNEEELKAISLINDLIQREIKELGVNTPGPINSDRIHFVNQEIADVMQPKRGGMFLPVLDAIIMNKDKYKDHKFLFYKSILHEIVHHDSFDSIFVMGNDAKMTPYRTGYNSSNIDDYKTHEHFRGFNEAVTQKMSLEIVNKYKELLVKELNISEEDQKEGDRFESFYSNQIEVLDLVINKMSEFYGKDSKEIWIKIKKGMITGEMMHLRDIEKVFGPGSLRFLSAMSSNGSIKKIEGEKLSDNFKNFFMEEDEEKRNAIAKHILSDRELLQYEKIIKK